jgi:hypothetical protein
MGHENESPEHPASVLSGPSFPVSSRRARREAAGPVDAGRTAVVTEPRIELIPARSAVCSDESVVLDVLVRIVPPLPDVQPIPRNQGKVPRGRRARVG